MPLGRTSRNSKRPSSSSASYASTVTTIVVVAFCVLAIWMLTSDTIISPQFSGGDTAAHATDTSDKLQLNKPSLQEEEKPVATTTTAAVDTTTTTAGNNTVDRAFHDSQGDLPRDALRNEDQTKDDSDLSKKDENTGGSVVTDTLDQEQGKGGGGISDPVTQELGDRSANEGEGGGGEEIGKVVERNANDGEEKQEELKIGENRDQTETEVAGGGEGAEEVKPDIVNSDMSGGGDDQNQLQTENVDNGLGDDNSKLSDELTSTLNQEQQRQQADDNGGDVPEDRDIINTRDVNTEQQDNNNKGDTNDHVTEITKTNSDQQDQAKQDDESNKPEDTSQDSEQKAEVATETNDEIVSNPEEEEQQKQPMEQQEKNTEEDQPTKQETATTTDEESDLTTTKQETTTDEESDFTSMKQENLSSSEQQEEELKEVSKESNSKPKTSTQEAEPTAEDGKTTSTALPNSGIPKESQESKREWSTQAANSQAEKEKHGNENPTDDKTEEDSSSSISSNTLYGYSWQLCNKTAGADYIPCLDNTKALKKLQSTKQYQHRERHCPEDPSTCLVPVPEGYKKPITWPTSREKIWFNNVPHTGLAAFKGHQNWVKVEGEHITFPGGGTQFIHGALHYIDFINKAAPTIAWGRHTRVVLDVGCGVASFGGFLFDRDVLTMSFAPKDEHEAQVQFTLERGIPAISAVMGSQRLPFPARVFDLVHCARCRVPWHMEGGRLLLELNRVLRPGGHFVWSATPVYQKLPHDVEIWEAMTKLTAKLCWQLVTIQRDTLNKVAAAIYRKPTKNECYDNREEDDPPMCKTDEDPNASWYVPIQGCLDRNPTSDSDRGTKWPPRWPKRLITPAYWLNKTQNGIYGKPAPEDFTADSAHWRYVVKNSYLKGLGISWEDVRNVMDMRAAYGGFAAALRDQKIWVMNVVNVNAPDTLPIIYERGLFGIYHDWCESFSTYPRTYDLLHADHLFSQLKKRCKLVPVMAEVDRIVRPGGKLIVRDESTAISEVENILKSLRWEVHLTFSKDQEGILSAQKSDWRPAAIATSET